MARGGFFALRRSHALRLLGGADILNYVDLTGTRPGVLGAGCLAGHDDHLLLAISVEVAAANGAAEAITSVGSK